MDKVKYQYCMLCTVLEYSSRITGKQTCYHYTDMNKLQVKVQYTVKNIFLIKYDGHPPLPEGMCEKS